MEKRPKINLELNLTDKLFELSGWIAISLLWIFILLNYSDLPESIPVHYNMKGEVDGIGNKSDFLELGIIATIIFTGLTILNFFPHKFNFPYHITTSNAMRNYTIATRLIRCVKLIMVGIFGYITYSIVESSKQLSTGLNVWILLSLTGILLFVIFYNLSCLFKTERL